MTTGSETSGAGPLPSVLVVEDDENLRLALTDNLTEEGYQVHSVAGAAAAIAAARENEFAVVVLDIMLPDGDGYSVCRRLREMGCTASVLMLTARTLEDDLVRGFESGADDYLAKPYRLRELLARVGALLRRGPSPKAAATPSVAATWSDTRRLISPDCE